MGYVPAANNGSQEDDSSISGEFRVALRKMSKKDATTKIKVSIDSIFANDYW